VHLGLQAPSEVAAATTAMLARVRAVRPDARIDGVLVQPMAPHGKELLLGMIRDPQFGPMVVVGFGGIYVEILKDTAARLCPLDQCEALDMLDEPDGPLLDGAGRRRGRDRCRAICRFAQLAVDATDGGAGRIRSWPVPTAWSPWTREARMK
jgi:hypothetical protein